MTAFWTAVVFGGIIACGLAGGPAGAWLAAATAFGAYALAVVDERRRGR